MEFIKKNRLLYWTVEVLLLAILILVLSSLSFIFEPIGIFFRTIFIPIIAAGFLYYLLHPVVDFLEKHFNLKHMLAVVLTFTAFLIIIASLFVTFLPQLIGQISNLLGTLPDFANGIRKNVNSWLRSTWFKQLGWQIRTNDFQQQISKYSSTFLRVSLSSLGNALSFLTTFTINIITIPIMLFYMLADADRFVPFVNHFIFPSRAKEVNDLAARMNSTIGRYIGGQFIEALFVMICVMVGYLIIRQPFAPLLGLFAGLCVLIPYVGPFIGMVPSMLIAITISTQQVLAVALVVIIVSQLDGNLIYPNVIGRNLKIHPLTIIIILLSAGNIWGLPGMILGVPIYAIIRTLVIFVYNIYQLKKDEQHAVGEVSSADSAKLLKKSANKENKNDA
ncbi:AI-2E family transporter [Oenococcus kitaharae]|uniref:Putative permease n=1 Tax=Oenococcus kitaharae DSM 17330 TaxID=1045004 RepID=G9WJ56_9LACO|nr:AI-2E family transporter [Oenococcus kitaharae]EHN58505.1 Putative permease [Oenococcus kitaharae DSM 17330]MCV3296256.1 AI-2E family transporter [Oenococcus kitaharae]OEY81343.1 membrane protein [Oenococcus kitaharae]OEY82831.1 membrane protein [Oenococcus kitaharae]OEY84625.1 membrane protein [Oenococcus kitaharae]